MKIQSPIIWFVNIVLCGEVTRAKNRRLQRKVLNKPQNVEEGPRYNFTNQQTEEEQKYEEPREITRPTSPIQPKPVEILPRRTAIRRFYTRTELNSMYVKELKEIAKKNGIYVTRKTKKKLIEEILRKKVSYTIQL